MLILSNGHTMKYRFSLLFLFVVCVTPLFGDDIPNTEDGMYVLSASYLDDWNYVFLASDESLKKGAVWEGGDQLRCGPKVAKAAALRWLNTNLPVVDDDQFQWSCTSMRLVNLRSEIWFWVVQCEYTIRVGGESGPRRKFSVPVIAGGSVPLPVKKSPVKHDE